MASLKLKRGVVLTSSTLSFTVCFMIWMMFAVIGIPIKEQLGLNETQFGLLAATPVLTGSLTRLPLGLLGDKYGGRIVLFLLMLSTVAPIYFLSMATEFWHFIVLGLFVGLLNMVPYLQIIGLIPAGLLAMMHAVQSGTNIWMVLGLTGLVFVVVQLIQDGFLTPKIMGKVTGLNPAMIMLSLSIWGKLLGLLGMIIALPVTYLLLVYYRRLIQTAPSTESISKP